MNTMHIKRGDTVIVLSGREKGKQGKVMTANPTKQSVIIEGVNFQTCHMKPKKQGEPGGIRQREGAVRSCKVMAVCHKCKKPTRVKHEINKKGDKVRVCKHCSAEM